MAEQAKPGPGPDSNQELRKAAAKRAAAERASTGAAAPAADERGQVTR
jgi:hypothetical protein